MNADCSYRRLLSSDLFFLSFLLYPLNCLFGFFFFSRICRAHFFLPSSSFAPGTCLIEWKARKSMQWYKPVSFKLCFSVQQICKCIFVNNIMRILNISIKCFQTIFILYLNIWSCTKCSLFDCSVFKWLMFWWCFLTKTLPKPNHTQDSEIKLCSVVWQSLHLQHPDDFLFIPLGTTWIFLGDRVKWQSNSCTHEYLVHWVSVK